MCPLLALLTDNPRGLETAADAAAKAADSAQGMAGAAAQNMQTIIEFYPAVMVWVYAALGGIFLLVGYRWFGALVAASGGIIGAFAGLTVYTKLQTWVLLDPDWAGLGALVGAILLGILARSIFKLALFLLAAFAGFWIAFYTVGYAAHPNVGWIDDGQSWLYIGFITLAIGVLGLILDKPLIVTTTSVVGAMMWCLVALVVVNEVPALNAKVTVASLMGDRRWALIVLFAVLTLAGVWIQYKKTGRTMTMVPRGKNVGYLT